MQAVAIKNTQEVTGLVKSESLAVGGAGRVQKLSLRGTLFWQDWDIILTVIL